MNREEHIAALAKLGVFINAWLAGDKNECDTVADGAYSDFCATVKLAVSENDWFTEEGVRSALAAISSAFLDEEKLKTWLQAYPYTDRASAVKPVGVIAAGNIPLVCFHDILCVLLTDYRLLLKPSSKDRVLVTKVAELLVHFEPKLKGRLTLIDAVNPSDIAGLIATGSNNTARYIEYEYSTVPILSRKNRTSVAILLGNETEEQLQLLANDIFSYFGMGCRNVTKLYVPQGYDFTLFAKAAECWRGRLMGQQKYASSYRHERAISLTLNEKVVDGEFFLVKESPQLNSPLSVICCEYFANLDAVKQQLIQNADMLQCVATANEQLGNVHFGQAQQPTLADYADGVDTIQWLNDRI